MRKQRKGNTGIRVMTENIPKLIKHLNPQVQEAECQPSRTKEKHPY